MNKQKLVVVGNGMAGTRCIEEILENDPNLFEITVFGSEPHVNYNRILLSTVLQGSTSFDDITINDREWYQKNKIQLFTGETVLKIDIEKRTVKTDKKREVSYDKLIIATGSVPFMIPIPGIEKEGVITFRTIEDCQKMIESSKKYKRAVVIGGGLLGLEAARGLLNLGMEVNVVHIASYLMERQLDPTAAKMLEKALENQGMNFLLEKETEEIIGNDRVEGLRFKDGTVVEADMVVMAVGVRPNIQLARESGIAANRAILVNDFMETNVLDIYAVGECAEHLGVVYGLVKPLYEQGRVLAKHICGLDTKGYQGTVLSTQLKISGVDVFSVGQFAGDAPAKAITIQDDLNGVYKKVVFQEKKMVGAVLFGDTSEGSRFLKMILEKKELSEAEKTLLYQASEDRVSPVISMGLSDIICNCHAVSKGTIVEAVQQGCLTTVKQVKECTKASGSCGGCKPLVTELLSYIQSDSFDEVIEHNTMCSCTNLTEDEVVREIQLGNLLSAQEVMAALGWKQSDGCSVCRGALDYYLGMIHPDYGNFVNENMDATRQSDGTYSIIPQMYGGMTNAEQLRKIADVVEKYRIPNVTVTSGQRILLMGIKKETLPNVWSDLKMPLRPPHRYSIQSVKTDIGDDVCQCDKLPSLQLAALLDKKLEFLKTPHPVTICVSTCIHSGEEAMTKDIGLIGIDRGWEIHAGGQSGRDVRVGELLYVAETSEVAIEMVTALIQYYRETASYLERSGQWIDRIGLIHIREVLFERDLRSQLNKRLEEDVMKYKEIFKRSFLSQEV
ncbi:nitrite reductase large subunit NirB [Bacillus sp. EB600]|uniref:nitrite reductase large subunit NirB n=1 Tax=Bacillus sp. EB600 TaxID=2806345 RepID=UPI00210ADA09|nr:nitrite reductase large subunit NirB [Bacillus sp. EB600]MCQ6282594.1 NAD(P)/FAD-dependent oxidoreductase [Bacillus sp. EB600]